MKKRVFFLGIALVLFALVASIAFAQNVNVVFENKSNTAVTVYFKGGDYIQLLPNASRTVSLPAGSTYEYYNSHLVRDVISDNGNKVTFVNR